MNTTTGIDTERERLLDLLFTRYVCEGFMMRVRQASPLERAFEAGLIKVEPAPGGTHRIFTRTLNTKRQHGRRWHFFSSTVCERVLRPCEVEREEAHPR